ncbi:hypothetical protein RhiirA1_488641 [Rhizophagus irregularis]|uniref:Sacsin/Nov domain-containing protein n=2 Tax=Rhizophagus irregularis TaxID=588596 RepID=A0A2I1F4J8_9GLOM|nr:hypothetical protein RhiirA1_488641 [Rhizophagus irregularis]PKY29304.1 hypothetical protein RhiirB3_474350 [Rhizophagus irregularis]
MHNLETIISMSVNDFRNQILSGSEEQIVEVNQRDLIDKILARYSSKHVIYRELLQNSDDAESKSIQIKFETEPNTDKVTRILFKNDGFHFRPEDWERLKKIAEGNPDEKKIGAFGVGFYSLFQVCENPFVSSGGQGMAFYWRGNKLYTKRGEQESTDNWTTFLFDMREPMKLEDVEEFAQFLVNSLGFTENLQEISVYFNDELVIQLSKEIQEPEFMEITPEFNRLSPQGLFYLTSVDVRDVKLSFKKLLVPVDICTGKFYPKNPTPISLKIASGNLDVSAEDEFSAKMKRITKKELPRETTIQMIYTGFEEHGNYVSQFFEDLLPYPEQGRIYIGFPTHQTTGCCSHLSARVIPTVERESIDLVDMTLAKYNSEILCLAGTLCRILYEDEMNKINRSIDTQGFGWFEEWAVRALTHFTFNTTTPNEQVGKITESQFFNCSEKLPILSTTGIFPISDVRIPNPEMAEFIRTVPLVPMFIFEQCETFFKKAKLMNLIRELNFHDVLIELESRVFSENEMIELLKWMISYLSKGNTVDTSEFERFKELARIKTIRYFLNPVIIPPSMDVPNDVMPYTISKTLLPQDLKKWFGWSELSLVNWARFIVNKPDLETDPTFAEKVHEILARNFKISESDRKSDKKNDKKSDKKVLRQLFERKRCIPTRSGMRIPSEAYFENVNLFPDLPTINFQRPSLNVKNLIEFFGVRKVVEMTLIIDRLTNHEDCDYMQLIKYLTSKSDDLKQNDINMLKSRRIWPKENSGSQQIQHFVISDLHIPLDFHRELGLPVIDWKVRWARNTPEEKFLIDLGIQQFPTLRKILELAAPPSDSEIRCKALRYFIINFERIYSRNYRAAEINVEFLPCLNDTYAIPLECFINPECTVMGFKVINRDLQHQVGKLGVRQHPYREELLNELWQNPPRDEINAEKIFEYLATRQSDFNRSDWNGLANFDFIPIHQSNGIFFARPCKCFFKVQDELKVFFLQIDFGDKANRFLQSCGVKDEPSSIEYAELLIKSSHKLLQLIGVEKYLKILKKIANDFSSFGNMASRIGLVSRMKKAPILVAITKESREINSEMKETNIYRLNTAKKIYINDDKIYQGIFNPLTAPEDDNLEVLYKGLGCKSLRDSVNEASIPIGSIQVTDESKKFQEIIIERASLFYFKYPKNDIKSDDEWLKKLKVREIDYIETSYTLGNANKTKKNNTSILRNNEMASWILYITSNSTSLDISKHIARNIYKSHEWKSIFAVNTLLTASLLDLKEMGYPVDRILQQQNSVADQINTKQENGKPISNVKPSIDDNSIPFQSQLNQLFPGQGIFPNASTSNSNSYTNKKPINIINKDPVTITNRESVNITNRRPVTITNKGPVTITNRESVTVANIELVNITNERSINITNEKSVDIKNREPIPITSETTRTLQKFLQDTIKTFYSDPKGITNNQANAKNVIKACSFDRGSIINHQDSIKIVHESQMNYCNIVMNLHCVNTFEGVELHISEDSVQLPQAFNASLNQFIGMLINLAAVFELAPKDIHVFYDETSNSIAFNRNSELFFNLKFYCELHDEECRNKPTINAMTYWFMMICHELSHNFIQHHNSEHEYYFLLFAEIYMPNYLEILRRCEIFY